MSNHVIHTMGMAVSVDLRDTAPDAEDDAIEDLTHWLTWVDEMFSTYRPSSAISRLDRREVGWDEAPSLVRWVLERSDELRLETDGYFDINGTGHLDPSGFVKGWAIDSASALLVDAGIDNHAINAGGDIRMRGRPQPGRPWRVAVAHPLVADAVCLVLDLGEGGIATSGTAERGAHVIDPHTGRAAIDLASVTVIGPDLTSADVYATAAVAMGRDAPAWLRGLAGYHSYVVDAGGNEWSSPGLVDLRAAA
jgi:thiamine biosynthesis lipoprotein